MRKKGLTPMFNTAQLDAWMDKFEAKAESKMIETFKYAGEFGVKYARENGNYTDHTGNLRSSIGFVIVKDGDIVEEDFEIADSGSGGQEGTDEARQLAFSVAKSYNKGIVLVLVAGMEYAASVESRNRDVISGAVIATEDFLRSTLELALRKAA